MYFSNIKCYINNNVLIDLARMEIYKISNEEIEIIEALSHNKDIEKVKKYESYEEIKNKYFDIENKEPELVYDVKNLQIKVSNTCNLNCKYCYAAGGNYNKKDCLMTVETAKMLCEKIKEFFPKLEKISFFGGEPLLNIPVIETIIRGLDRKDILYSTVTNATVVDDTLIDLIKNYKVKVIASLDGPKDIQDKHRVTNSGKGTFDIVDANIKRIIKETDAVEMIAAVYTAYSHSRMTKEELYKYIYDRYGVKNIGIANVFTDDETIKLPKEYENTLEKSIDELIEDFMNALLNKKYLPIETINDILFPIINRNIAKTFCGAGLSSLIIDEEGNICPCQLFINDEKHYMGNIFDSSEALNSRIKKVQKYIEENNVKDNIEECTNCVCKYWCFRCIGQNKDKKNYGCCKVTECDASKVMTEKVLDKVTELVAKDEFYKLLEGYDYILESSKEIWQESK